VPALLLRSPAHTHLPSPAHPLAHIQRASARAAPRQRRTTRTRLLLGPRRAAPRVRPRAGRAPAAIRSLGRRSVRCRVPPLGPPACAAWALARSAAACLRRAPGPAPAARLRLPWPAYRTSARTAAAPASWAARPRAPPAWARALLEPSRGLPPLRLARVLPWAGAPLSTAASSA
jgi:hypothetical protein